MAHSKEQNQLTETVHKEAQTLDLLDKGLTVLKMVKELKENMDKELKKIRKKMSEQNGNIYEQIVIIKRNQANSEPEK